MGALVLVVVFLGILSSLVAGVLWAGVRLTLKFNPGVGRLYLAVLAGVPCFCIIIFAIFSVSPHIEGLRTPWVMLVLGLIVGCVPQSFILGILIHGPEGVGIGIHRAALAGLVALYIGAVVFSLFVAWFVLPLIGLPAMSSLVFIPGLAVGMYKGIAMLGQRGILTPHMILPILGLIAVCLVIFDVHTALVDDLQTD